MARRKVHIGEGTKSGLERDISTQRMIFWVISGILIFGVLWFLTIPALMYD